MYKNWMKYKNRILVTLLSNQIAKTWVEWEAKSVENENSFM